VVRSKQEWAEHPQGQAVAGMPLVTITRIGASPPEPLPDGDRPAAGVRVIDLTRVLAGPTCAKTIAEHGADVLAAALIRWYTLGPSPQEVSALRTGAGAQRGHRLEAPLASQSGPGVVVGSKPRGATPRQAARAVKDLLSQRGAEGPVTIPYGALVEAPPSAGRHGIEGHQHPVIESDRPVEPQGVIQAGPTDVAGCGDRR
jgi:hypothetical protein